MYIHWLRSGNNNNTNNANGLSPAGANSWGNVNNWLSVRPALHSKKCLRFKGESLVSQWLRSGNQDNTNNVHGLAPTGSNNGGNVNNWLSVRPALHSKNAYNLRANA